MKTADPELTRGSNRFRIIDVIRRHGPIARVEIVAHTELSPATVSAITGGLIEDGLVVARHVETAEVARGRPRVMLALNAGILHVAGVKLSLRRISVAVTDLCGNIVGSLVMPVRLDRQPVETIADLIEDGVRQCAADCDFTLGQLSGIGIGVPGVIDGRTGRSHWSPVLGPGVVDFAALVARRLGRPVMLENDANLAALAENWFGRAQDVGSFAVVTAEDTVGMGLLLDGRLHRGAHGIGAEFGHVKTEPGGLECRCGQRGCLDTLASGWSLGDHPTTAQLEKAGHHLGLALANVLNVLNLPRVILTGSIFAHATLLDRLQAAIETTMVPTLREATGIIRHEWGDEMWARGAASLVLRLLYGEASDAHRV